MTPETRTEKIEKALKRHPCRCNTCVSRLVWELLKILKPEKANGVWLSSTGLTFDLPVVTEDTDEDKFVLLWKDEETFKDAKPT